MDYKVVFCDPFLEDSEGIVSQLAVENVPAAHKLGELIVSLGESLSFFPERYPRVRQRPELRRYIAAKRYKIFYRVQSEQRLVMILRCWDDCNGCPLGD